MRILIIVDCYLPHTKSSAKLIHDLALELRDAGHAVTVLTPDDSVSAPIAVTSEDGIHVARIRTGRIKGAPRVFRGLREAMLSDLLWMRSRRYFQAHEQDAIVFYSPSIFFGKLVRRLKRLWGCRAYLVVRDLFPQWALDAGVLRRGPAYYFFKLVELRQYSTADIVGVQSPANLAYFEGASFRPQRIEVLYNWARVDETPQPRAQLDSLQLNERFVFFFGGNIGVAQDMDAIIRLAATLHHRRDLAFLLVGDGSEVPRLSQEIRRRGLENIVMHPAVDQQEYARILSRVDVGLVALNGRLTTQNIPGKLLGYLQAGLPVLASLNPGNDLGPLLGEARAGLCATSGDDERMRSHALALADDAHLRRELAANARKLLRDRFSARAAARQILSALGAASVDPGKTTEVPAVCLRTDVGHG